MKSVLYIIIAHCLIWIEVLCGPAWGLETAATRRQAWQTTLEKTVMDLGLPGAEVAVSCTDGTRWTGVAGIARITSQPRPRAMNGPPDNAMDQVVGYPMKPSLKFHIGSIKKTFVAALCLMLSEEKILNLDDTLYMWLPEVAPIDRNITIRQLLNHSSGLPSHTDNAEFYKRLVRHPLHKWTPRELFSFCDFSSTYFPPGQGWYYSNTNYILLGEIIEKATQKPMATLLKERIIVPLGLKNTYLPADEHLTGPHLHAYRYDFLDRRGVWTDVTEFVHPSFLGHAGAMVSTTDDLLTWLKALLSGPLLSEGSRLAMCDFLDTGEPGRKYGLGLEWYDGAVGHEGDYVFGYQSLLLRSGDCDYAVLANGFPTKLGVFDGPGEIFRKITGINGSP
jgi:D-alanyl-D-alanine carboxypeptidase